MSDQLALRLTQPMDSCRSNDGANRLNQPMTSRRSRSRSSSRSKHVWSSTPQPQPQPHRPTNNHYKAALQSGLMVPFTCGGNSCILDPVVDHLALCVGDVVFCQLDIGGPYYLHKISRIFTPAASAPRAGDENVGQEKYDISSPSGDIFGSCYSDTIYGRRSDILEGNI